MVGQKTGVKATCANAQKGREALAQRRAAEAEDKAQAVAAEAEAKAQADACAYEHQLQQQQQADMHLREQQVTEQQHQLQQQQADVLLRERQVAEQQHQLQQQQQADMHLREKHVAEQQHQLQLQLQLNRLQQQLEAQSGAELQRQVQQQLAVQQHLWRTHVEKQLQEAADQQAVSNNHPLPDHPTCSSLVPGSLRSPLFKRPRQDTTLAPMPRHHSVAHALRIPGLPYSAVVGAHQSRSLATAPPPPQPRRAQQAQSNPTQPPPSIPSCLPPPPLHGGTASGLAVRAWGQALTEFFSACSMPGDLWVPYAAGRLTGGAEVWWFHQVFNNTPAATCWMAFVGGLCEHYTQPEIRAWQPAAQTSATRATAQRVQFAAPTVLTSNRFAPLRVADEYEVREDEECYALLMLYHSDLLHDEVCFGKLTNKHCERYRMHMGWKREEGRRELRRLVLRELRTEELEAEYEADN